MSANAAISLTAERLRRERQYIIRKASELEFMAARCGDYGLAEAAKALRAEMVRFQLEQDGGAA
jgi:hypothetical protein